MFPVFVNEPNTTYESFIVDNNMDLSVTDLNLESRRYWAGVQNLKSYYFTPINIMDEVS